MIKKLQITAYQEMMGYGIDLCQTVNKVNEIIDYLNEQEKINSRRVNIAEFLKGE